MTTDQLSALLAQDPAAVLEHDRRLYEQQIVRAADLIAAVRRMQQRSGSARATDEMCRLIVLNTASIQLLPTTVAAVRAANGAAAPFDILPAVWLTSVCSVTAGLLAAFLFGRASRA